MSPARLKRRLQLDQDGTEDYIQGREFIEGTKIQREEEQTTLRSKEVSLLTVRMEGQEYNTVIRAKGYAGALLRFAEIKKTFEDAGMVMILPRASEILRIELPDGKIITIRHDPKPEFGNGLTYLITIE